MPKGFLVMSNSKVNYSFNSKDNTTWTQVPDGTVAVSNPFKPNTDNLSPELFLSTVCQGHTTFCAFNADSGKPTEAKSFHLPSKLDKALLWAKRLNNSNNNIYFSVNQTEYPIHKKPNRDDIPHIYTHVIDIDPMDVLHLNKEDMNSEKYQKGRALIINTWKELAKEYKPTFVIDSGNGIQMFWVRVEPIDKAKGEQINKALAKLTPSDPCVYNSDRIMRLPGTHNHRTKSKEKKGYPAESSLSTVLYYDEKGHLPVDLVIEPPHVKKINTSTYSSSDTREIKAALAFISADCAYDSDSDVSWIKVIMGVHAETKGSDKGLALVQEWSSTTTVHPYDPGEVEVKWLSFSEQGVNEGISIGTVYKWAKDAGWTGGTMTLAEVKAAVDLLAVINGVVDIEWCKLVVEAKLSHAEAEVIINSLVTRNAGSKRALNADLKAYKDKEKTKKKAGQMEESRGIRIPILYNPLDINGMIHESEAAMLSVPGRYEILHNGSFYIRVKVTAPTGFHAIDANDKLAPDTAIFFIYDATAMLLRLEQSIQFCKMGKDGLEEIPVPNELPKHMTLNPEVQAGVATGLITHPITYPTGEILIQQGFDHQSGLYLHTGGVRFIDDTDKVLTQADCNQLINKIHDKVFSEFEFCDNDIDTAVAMAMLFTAVQRKILDIAPGFVATANVQGSGKTTLARMIYVILTGSDMPVTSLSPDANEAKKEITTHLMEQIEMMCIDNEPDGSTLRSPIIAKIVTASEFKGRVLGYSKNATVKTNVMLVYTGNNLEVDADFVRRLLVCHLEPTCEKPEQRKFKHPDIVEYCRSIRLEILSDITTIIRSFILSGDVIDITPSGYPQWDKMVRKPMIWAGYKDPMESCNKTQEESPDIQGAIALVTALHDYYDTNEFTSTKVSKDIEEPKCHSHILGINAPELAQVFDEYFPMHKRDARGIGAVFKKIIGRRIKGKYLAKKTVKGISQYWVK